jgi:hypothetical protein
MRRVYGFIGAVGYPNAQMYIDDKHDVLTVSYVDYRCWTHTRLVLCYH